MPVSTERRKRGRKPRGGKVVNAATASAAATSVSQNIILHLLCSTSDVVAIEAENSTHDSQISGGCETSSVGKICEPITQTGLSKTGNDLWEKVRKLNDVLHRTSGLGKSSDCFWCTCGFSTPPIHIPRCVKADSIECYGCFCSPECALAFLLKEGVDKSQTWERVALLNTVYGAVFDYSKSIRPAPPPHYLLDKYYGSLTVEEYRELLGSNKRLIVVDRPLTRAVPHLFDDCDEMSDPSLMPVNKNEILKSAFGCV